MPKGPTRPWRQRLEPILDDLIRASVAQGQEIIHPPGEHDLERGTYALLTIDDESIKTAEDAWEIKKALKRAGSHTGYNVNAWPVEKKSGGYQVKFRACCSECARAWLIQKHGADRSKWPYDPLRKRNETDHK